jgi:hypothetical protein
MISFNNIGNLGRLANQMFQYASLKGIAKNRGFDYCIPPKDVFGKLDPLVRRSDTNLYECFDIKCENIGITAYKNREESTFAFDENLFNNCEDDTNINGYFQTERYFKNVEDEIREEFQFKSEIFDPSKEQFDEFFPGTEVISLHIRRGDYITNPNHPVQSLEYYESALNELDKNIPVLILSDDPKWCNQQKLFEDDRFFVSDLGNSNVDLCLMTMCDYHIIANSSFSWWGSWLSKSKKTIAPKLWFGDRLSREKDTKDIYLKDWILI